MCAVRRLRLHHSALPFWIDVRVREFDGRWIAVADLAGQPDLGCGGTPREALQGALGAFNAALASDLAGLAEVQLASQSAG